VAWPWPINRALRRFLHSDPLWSDPIPMSTFAPQRQSASLYCNVPANPACA
jgi:hypothetical protein